MNLKLILASGLSLLGLGLAALYAYAIWLSIEWNSLLRWPTHSWPQAPSLLLPLFLGMAALISGLVWLVFELKKSPRRPSS